MLVLIPDAQFEGPPEVEERILGPGVRLAVHRARHAASIPDAQWRDAEGILAWHEISLDAALIGRLDRTRVVCRVGAGFDNVDIAAAARRGIAVCNVPDYGVNEVADHAIALTLALGRGIVRYHAQLADDPVRGWVTDKTPLIRRLAGLEFGIVGMGRIGTATARRAASFGMEVRFFDPYLATGAELGLGYKRAERLDDLLAEADIISLHTPLTAETRGMIDARALALMKPSTILVNTARGPIVDTDALTAALEDGRIAGAALDVLPAEPPGPTDRLTRALAEGAPWTAGRLIVTPHAAWYSRDSYVELREKAARVVADALRGGLPRNCVNRHLMGKDKD